MVVNTETVNDRVNRLKAELARALVECHVWVPDPRFPFPDTGWVAPYPYPDPHIARFFYLGNSA